MNSSVSFPNKTVYFVPTISRDTITVSNPDLHQVKVQKMEGYETRLYYEYQLTLARGGFAQFFTLTYNDNRLPKFHGIPCIDNRHIRYLFHDTVFFRKLESRYGYTFKYFVGAEFGDGGESHNYKGQRGAGNNPHFHLILFLTPLLDPKTGLRLYPHVNLHPYVVKKAIMHYWQGDALNPRNFDFGLIHTGKVDINGVIRDFRAISYASKYCVKDQHFKDSESKLYAVVCKKYGSESRITYPDSLGNHIQLRKNFLDQKYNEFLKQFRSRHSQRVLCSHGLGLSALDSVSNLMDPKIKMPTTDGVKLRSLPIYLYRKLYCDVVKDENNKYFYRLNELGKKYKISKLPDNIDKLSLSTRDNIYSLVCNPDLFESMLNSEDCNYLCPFCSFDGSKVVSDSHSLSRIKNLLDFNTLDVIDNIFYRYSIYETIYKNRYGSFLPDGNYPYLDFLEDYRWSLINTHKPIYHNPYSKADIHSPMLFSFDDHPYFSDDIDLFRWFSSVNSYLYVKKDRVNMEKYEAWLRQKKILNNIRFNTYF